MPANKVQNNVGSSARKVLRQVSENLLARSASKTGLLAALLVMMTVMAYLPATQCGYIWDDDRYVTENPLLAAPDGLWRIWFSTDSPSQYFPMVYTSFRFEYALWELNPRGYHITNILLHTANALLLWCVLRGLSIPGAWLAAAFFALHPVHVESVAWITERKNVLMAFFSLLSLLAWMRFADRSHRSQRARLLYLLSLLLCALALLSKATACMLPVALVLLLWLKRIPVNVKRWLQIAPYVLLGLTMGMLVMWWEKHHQGTGLVDLGLNPIERVLIASRALWFYIGKLFWPVNLTFSYAQWKIDATALLQYGWLLACLVVVWCMWRWRDKLGRGAIAAIVFFVANLLPMLGFLSLYTFVYTYVADHYQYMASVGPISLVVAVGYRATARLGGWGRGTAKIVVILALATLGALTWHQVHIYKDLETLWRDTLRKNPESWMAYNNLGSMLASRDKLDEAMVYFRQALQLKSDYSDAHYNMGLAFQSRGELDEAVNHYRQVLQVWPNDTEVHYKLGLAFQSRGELDEAVNHYRQVLEFEPDNAEANYNLADTLVLQGKVDEAIGHYRRAIEVRPDWLAPLNSMARILASYPDPKVRDASRAVELAERAAELTKYQDVVILDTLAAAYAATGQFDRAVTTAQAALALASAAQADELANYIRKRLELYKQAKP